MSNAALKLANMRRNTAPNLLNYIFPGEKCAANDSTVQTSLAVDGNENVWTLVLHGSVFSDVGAAPKGIMSRLC